MCKKCWSLVTILLLLIAAGAYKFLIQGSTVPASDGRVAIQLSTGERDLVLSEHARLSRQCPADHHRNRQ